MAEKVILCCKCGDTPQFSRDAFSLLYPDEPIPEVYAGNAEIYDLYKRYPDKGEFSRYIHSLARNKTKFAYMIEWSDDGSIMHIIDLKTAKEVA